MLTKFREHIDTSFSFLYSSKLLLACSGGLDSMVLANLLLECNLQFSLAHCNYKLRGEDSDLDEEFVSTWSAEKGIIAFTKVFDLSKEKGSIQLEARTRRYDWFNALSEEQGFDHILTAHHANDNLETFVINLSRGTGLDGLTGIPESNQKIVRPLLPFSREEILDYAKENSISWREDKSNKDLKYLRNTIRHQVVPNLEALHPTFLDNFQLTLSNLNLSSQLLNDYAERLKSELFRYQDDGIYISIVALGKLKPSNAYLFLLFKAYGFTQWKDIKALLTAPSGKETHSKTHRLIKDREDLILTSFQGSLEEDYHIIAEDGENKRLPIKLQWKEVEDLGEFSPNTLYVDKEKLNYPLKLRKWKIGDYFYPLGMQGKKKLSKFFKDEKYNTIEKENQWLLCSEDKIIWVLGKRADDRFKVTEKTKQIVKFILVS